jgi:hypothetical protein
LPRLEDGGIQAGEGDQLIAGVEGLDRIGLAKEADGADTVDSRQGKDVSGQLIGQGFNFGFELLSDGGQGFHLGQQCSDTDPSPVQSSVGADGMLGGLPDLVGLGTGLLAARGFADKFGEFIAS